MFFLENAWRLTNGMCFLDYWKMIKNSEVLHYWKMHNHTDVFGMIGT